MLRSRRHLRLLENEIEKMNLRGRSCGKSKRIQSLGCSCKVYLNCTIQLKAHFMHKVWESCPTCFNNSKININILLLQWISDTHTCSRIPMPNRCFKHLTMPRIVIYVETLNYNYFHGILLKAKQDSVKNTLVDLKVRHQTVFLHFYQLWISEKKHSTREWKTQLKFSMDNIDAF